MYCVLHNSEFNLCLMVVKLNCIGLRRHTNKRSTFNNRGRCKEFTILVSVSYVTHWAEDSLNGRHRRERQQ